VLDTQLLVRSEFQENWRFELELGPYVVKIAESYDEVEQAIRLRSRVFRDDFGATCDPDDPLWDWTELDEVAAHLVVMTREGRQVVGTYRLILSESGSGFYSQSEFDLSELLALPGLKLELSRACVDRMSRTGAVMALLWKGLAETARRSCATHVFGCSSLLTESPDEVRSVLDGLGAEGFSSQQYGVRVLPEYRMNAAPLRTGVPLELPPLLRLYLKAGAKVAPEPAHDRVFRCVDLLTVLDIATMDPTLARKYGLAR
jgi:putative hemolysin